MLRGTNSHYSYVGHLKSLGRLLVNLPGGFGDFEARIAAKVASLDGEITRIVALTFGEAAESPFRDPLPEQPEDPRHRLRGERKRR